MKLAGLALIAVGVLDPLLGLFVIGPRILDPAKRRVLVATLVGSGVLLLVVGALMVAGVFPVLGS
jgi:hypothetical protein